MYIVSTSEKAQKKKSRHYPERGADLLTSSAAPHLPKIPKLLEKSSVLCYNISRQPNYKGLDLHPKEMEVMHMKNLDFKDLMAFGTFLIALLTFIFMFS